MNRLTEPDEILAMPDTERDAYAAEVCMGWFIATRKPTDERWYAYGELGEYVIKETDWQPSQPTEKGMAQCLQLMFDFGIIRLWEDYDLLGFHYTSKNTPIKPHVWEWDGQQEYSEQDCIVTTAILSALAEKEK